MAILRSVAFFILSALIQGASSDRFQKWMPSSRARFEDILVKNCSSEHDNYLAATNYFNKDKWCDATTACILSFMDERSKAAFASSNVMLGLVPVILTLMGPTTAECALLGLRRPLLALLIAAASPSKNPTRGASYWNAVEDNLMHKVGRLRPHRQLSSFVQNLIVAFELSVVAAACFNVYYLSWTVGAATVFTLWCTRTFGPLLWTVVAVLAHAFGCFTFSLRALQNGGKDGSKKDRSSWRVIKQEFTPCGCHDPTVLHWRDESYVFVGMAWITSIFSMVHILFGTLWFSSVVFIHVSDSLGVLGRYLASAVACRAILMYELSGLRETMGVEETSADMEMIVEGSEGGPKS